MSGDRGSGTSSALLLLLDQSKDDANSDFSLLAHENATERAATCPRVRHLRRTHRVQRGAASRNPGSARVASLPGRGRLGKCPQQFLCTARSGGTSGPIRERTQDGLGLTAASGAD